MSKTFRPWKIDEALILPPTVQDFVAKDHLARFVLNLVRDDINLAEITGTYGSERGQPPFDPTMMTALLLYSYCCGIYASRRIAKGCRERVDFMSIVAVCGVAGLCDGRVTSHGASWRGAGFAASYGVPSRRT